MSTEFLDKTGLSYFWSKIKAWATAAFAAVSHVHASSDVTAMTGYSKAGAGSAIAVGDSLNAAIGKLEYKVDAYDDSNYVHRTGDETVGGTKTYVPTGGSDSSITWAHNYVRNQYLDRTVDDGKVHYTGLVFCDAVNDASGAYSDGRIGSLSFVTNMTDDYSYAALVCREYMMKSGLVEQAPYLRVGVDANGNAFASAPVTRTVGVSNEDIITYGYLNSDIVVAGKKLFTTTELQMRHAVAKGTMPSSASYRGIYFLESGGDINNSGHAHRFGRIESVVNSSSDGGDTSLWLSAYANSANSTASASLVIRWDKTNGIGVATAPPTSTTRTDGADIVTRDWIPKDTRIVHTTGNETIAGYKEFSNRIVNTQGAWKPFDAQKNSLDRTSRPASGSSAIWSGVTAFSDKNNKDLAGLFHYVDYNTSALIISCDTFGYNDSNTESISLWACISNADKTRYFQPNTQNNVSLGTSSRKWKDVWANTGTIQTSDERVKTNVERIPDDVLDAWGEVEFLQFQFNDAIAEKGDAARLHGGVIAQRLDEAFRRHGISADRYGFFCYDEWDAVQECRNGEGVVMQPEIPAGNQYSVRYEEALCVEAAYQRRENARLKARLAALEDRLAALELRLGSE